MAEGNGAASLPATPSNFQATIARNTAAAAPAPSMPAAPAQSPVARAPQGVPAAAPANQQQSVAEDPAAVFNEAIRQQQQQPANDNAQPLDAELAALQGQPAADPFAEQVHGLELRAIVDAIKQGQLPAPLLEALKVVAKVNGRELPISVREAANGYMRLSDYTQATQRVGADMQQLEQTKATLRSLFNDWDKPEAFEQGMFRMGLVPQARAMVTKEWNTPQGFLDSMRRLGHWETFVKAADAFGMQWAAEQKLDPQTRAELERQRDEMWKARLAAETDAEAAKRKAWEQERDQLLRAQQSRPNQAQAQAQLSQIHDLKTRQFQERGVKPSPAADKYFVENYAALARLAKSRGQQVTVAELVSQAVQATAEQLSDVQWAHQQALGQQQPAAPAQAAPQPPVAQPPAMLPARPAAAPATAPSPIKRGGTPDDFLARIQALQGMAPRR